MAKSIEEKIEDLGKKQLGSTKYFTKTESINAEIDNALKNAPSKSGGSGPNFPDIKLFIETKTLRRIPVMIECKGTKGDLIRLNSDGEIDNYKKDKTPNYPNIKKYAVNGAVHYANAIIDLTSSYKEVIAIGMNGYYDGANLVTEFGVYYVSLSNYKIPKKIGDFSDLSFLQKKNIDAFVDSIDKLTLSEDELERKAKAVEDEIEAKLKDLNQVMNDSLEIPVKSRVELVTGMIMAALGVDGEVAPLEISDLKGNNSTSSNDGLTIINQIASFLQHKNLPKEKKDMIINDLQAVFIYSELWRPIQGESKLKTVYSIVKSEIMPIFTSAKHLDFTGKLFNTLNEWVDVPDSEKNDVVLTPRYITDFMAKLGKVNMDSYVWDYAVGSAGFLISSMKLMIKDAEKRIKSAEDLEKKIQHIKHQQLLGVEKRADIYMLAVLNMILMGDGSANIIHKNSLTEFEGKYEQGKDDEGNDLAGKEFPATLFLLNPPYSASGKGFIFVEKALKKMRGGRAVILIQENAGSGKGLPYTTNILQKNTLVASIHLADIFKGKAGVQTAIYVFDIGTPHDEKSVVKFINFSNDGYARLHRKKSSQSVNLRNVDHANERYEEVVNLVLYGKSHLKYLTDEDYVEDTISLSGKDWTFMQHAKYDTKPQESDFDEVISQYISWELTTMLSKRGK